MSGRTNILMKAEELGFKLEPDAPETREITGRIKELEGRRLRIRGRRSLAGPAHPPRAQAQPAAALRLDEYHVSVRGMFEWTGQAAGGRGALVRTGYGREEETAIGNGGTRPPDGVFDDLGAAVRWWLAGHHAID